MNLTSLRKIAAHYTWCPRLGLTPRAILTFDADGRLLAIETDVSEMDSLQGIEFFSGILIPGMVNAHCHLELSYLKNAIPPRTGLTDFVRQVAEKRNNTPLPERIHAADVQNSVMKAEGIVAVGDICNDDFTFPLKQNSALYYHNFIELFGIDPARADSALERGQEVARQAERYGLPFSLSPHSTYSVSDPLFEAIVQANPPFQPLSIHFMESPAEQELFENRGVFSERYRREGLAVDLSGFGSPAQRLVESIPAETPLLLIHNTFVSKEEIERVHAHFQKVTWVVCPRSNHYIEDNFPPIELLQAKGCRIAVGTDSLSSNTTLSLLDEFKYITKKRPGISLPEMLSWGTLRGAEALEISSRAGSFEIGKAPGVVLLDHIDWGKMALTPESTARRII